MFLPLNFYIKNKNHFSKTGAIAISVCHLKYANNY